MKYLAYGSNMNHKQMKRRCPDSQFLGGVKLPGHKLIFDGYSQNWKSAVANIIESKDDYVWGRLFKISKSNLATLDICEGYSSKTYDRKQVHVFRKRSRIDNVFVYFRVGKKPGVPSQEYKLICGLTQSPAMSYPN